MNATESQTRARTNVIQRFTFGLTISIALAGAGMTFAAEEKAVTGDAIKTDKGGDLVIQPINHATFAMQWNKRTIYVDPVGTSDRYKDLPEPDLILLTDVHNDHLNTAILGEVVVAKTRIIAPQAVTNRLPEALRAKTTILANGEKKTIDEIEVEAVPMYNLTQERIQFHAKGRGNGYVVTLGGKRIYISGDTEDIPEMRALMNIEVAFVCMNLPYTMTPDQAASAVREFKPKIVYPYHYRGSDVEKFKAAVEGTPGIEVRLKKWY